MTERGDTAPFRLGYVPGVTPGKWVRIWSERRPHDHLELVPASTAEAVELIRTGALDAGVVRLPIDRTGLHAIPLYTETTVAVVPTGHLLTAAEQVDVADLADDVVLRPADDTLVWPGDRPGRAAASDPATTAGAIELVAAGVGLLVVPQSLARLHHRRDLTYRPLTGAPTSGVALTWPDDETTGNTGNTDQMEEFIGVVRGRTVNSTRTPRQAAENPAPAAPAASAASRRRPARRGTRRR